MELILPENTGAAALKQLEYQLDERTLYYTSSKQAKTTVRVVSKYFSVSYKVFDGKIYRFNFGYQNSL